MSGKARLSPGKSYRLLHYLNRQHSKPERLLMAAAGYTSCLAVTGSPTLACQLWCEFREDNFKDGLRRAHWYATRGWPGLGPSESDPFFCFSDGLSLKESRAMADWVGGRADRLPPLEAATARLTAKAQVVHQATLADNQPLAAQTLAEFQDEADRLLASLQAKRADTASRMEAENQERGVSDQEQPADFAREDAEAALHDVAQLLPLEQWGWTALSGTFLGIFREGDFLPHDFDIDLGLPAERTDLTRLTQLLEASPLFESVRADHQYRLHCTPEGLRVDVLPVLVKAVHCNGIAVDFSLLYDEGGIWWHGSMMHRWDHTPQELVAYELRGVRILGPRDGDRYLTEGYGDWRTPVRSFNCSSGRHNLVVVQNLLGVCLFLKRLVWHLSNADANGYDAVLAQMLRQSLLTEVGAGAPRFNRHWFDSCPQQRAGGDQHGD